MGVKINLETCCQSLRPSILSFRWIGKVIFHQFPAGPIFFRERINPFREISFRFPTFPINFAEN